MLHQQGNYSKGLFRAARELGDPEGMAEAERELARLQESDPAGAALDARLAAVLAGQPPADDAEQIKLAIHAHLKELYASSVRFWDEALAHDPHLGDDRQSQHRYNAACAAALAGSGRGKDHPSPDDAVRATLRRKALAWLTAELSAWKRVAMTIGPGNKETVAQTLRHWKADADLAGIRDAAALAGFSEEERAALQRLWDDVDSLLSQVERGK